MRTIHVTGTATIRMPERIEEILSELTTVKECQERQARNRRRIGDIEGEIDDLISERHDLEAEVFWLPNRLEEILAENPEEAAKWEWQQAVNHPNQLRLPLIEQG